MKRFNVFFISFRLMLAGLLLTGIAGIVNAQKKPGFLDKVNKTIIDATKLANTTTAFVSAAKRTSAEFGKTVKVEKGTRGGDNNEKMKTVPPKEVTKPKIKNGDFTNLKWEPVTYFEGQLFPSTIVSMASYKGKIEGELEAISRPLGFRITSKNSYIPLKWEIESIDKNYFDKISGAYFYEQAGQEVYLMPEIPWQYGSLSKQITTIPLSIVFRLFDEEGNKVEKSVALQLRSINDCIMSYKELDLTFLFTAFIQEEHPEIDNILKEALNTKMISASAIIGYQGKNQDQTTYEQAAAIWKVLHDRGFEYSSITTTSGDGKNTFSQAVRTFDNALKTKQANCVDGTVAFASILRKIGISTQLILVPGHCFLSFYSSSKKDKIFYLETTMLSKSYLIDNEKTPAGKAKAYWKQFDAALAEGMAKYKAQDQKNIRVIDVDYWRSFVKPLPF